MTAKEYLSQAWQLKMRIESMTEILEFMKSSAEHITPSLTDMPKAATRNIHRIEDAIVRFMDYEECIQTERDKLTEVTRTITGIGDPTAQAVIVKRYIERKTWLEIAADIYASERHARRVHESALAEIEGFLKSDRECP